MPPSSASATGALTWSSDSTAASATCGHAAEVRGPRGVPLLPRSVVPVVAGQIQLAEVEDRVLAVQFESGEGDPLLLLGRGQVRLVVRVRQRPGAGPRLL